MPLEKSDKFLLKRLRPMMLGLPRQVSLDMGEIRITHGERPVTGLPGEIRPIRQGLVDPFRGVGPDESQGVGDGQLFAEADQEVT